MTLTEKGGVYVKICTREFPTNLPRTHNGQPIKRDAASRKTLKNLIIDNKERFYFVCIAKVSHMIPS